MTPTLNVNLKSCTHGCGTPIHALECAGQPILITCPLPRTVTFEVVLGECACTSIPGSPSPDAPVWDEEQHDAQCPARHIRVTCSISGETWERSEVAAVDAEDGLDDGRRWMITAQTCRERWALVKALLAVGSWSDAIHPHSASVHIGELRDQRDAVFAALADKVRAEQVDDATTRELIRLVPGLSASEVANATADDYLSAKALARYVSDLIAAVGAL